MLSLDRYSDCWTTRNAPSRLAYPDRPRPALVQLQRSLSKANSRGFRPAFVAPPTAYFFSFGGLIMMCAPAVPGYMSHGAVPEVVDKPVDSGVA